MRGPNQYAGMALTIFFGMLAAFNWPLLSIPRGEGLLLWLFLAWAMGIGLLGLSSLLARRQVEAKPRADGQDGDGGADD